MADETFFTVIGCMDGRCVDPIKEFGKKEFAAQYADTITEPGIVGILSSEPSADFIANLKNKIEISLNKHKSKGIIIDGHAECAGDPVSDDEQKKQINGSVKFIRNLINDRVPVVGIFIHRCPKHFHEWEADKLMLSASL